MNEKINKFLLDGDKLTPKMHLKLRGFTYSACRPFSTNKEQIQKFKETEDSEYIDQNELETTCFQHDIAYEDFKDLPKKQLQTKYYMIKHLIL